MTFQLLLLERLRKRNPKPKCLVYKLPLRFSLVPYARMHASGITTSA